jgi:hypothetical protein
MTRPSTILPVAVRAYAEPLTRRGSHRPLVGPAPDAPVLVFDTECRIDATQRLTFGCWRVLQMGTTIDEGLIHADDLPTDDLATLRAYVGSHQADMAPPEPLRLLSRTAFMEQVFWKVVYHQRGLVVGFNLPFDLARLGIGWGTARGSYYGGGFSLVLWGYRRNGESCEDRYRPRIAVKSIDSKRALMGFTKRRSPDPVDLIPEGATDGTPQAGYCFPGHFLDLKALAFALTNEPYSLAKACAAFGVEHGKQTTEAHGVITPTYIDYARRDVLATSELLAKLLEEHARHPIALPPSKAFSPASIGKAYLRAMGIRPILERQPDFPQDVLGWAMAAYYGGRAECHIRKEPAPVVYVDFLSMYPTVNTLMGLWRFLTAERIEVVDATSYAQHLLADVDLDRCFDPAFWRELPLLVQVDPRADVFPVRSKYGETDAWQIALNQFEAGEPFWYTLADCVASTLLAGKAPRVLRALRLVPSEDRLNGLRPVRLRGVADVDPQTQDLFGAGVELRKNLPADLPELEQDRTQAFIKVLMNSTSYGIFAEMNRQDSADKDVAITVHGLGDEPFTAKVTNPEEPGEFCFPPLAAFIAGAARLMLALLERCITDLGGTYAMCDTDSMAIVASASGGLVPCPGGSHRFRRKPAIYALSWEQVNGMVDRFAALNPYDRTKISGSILKIEDVNFDANGQQRQVWCYAISAKRYALYTINAHGEPTLVDGKEHGLGHLLNPVDPSAEEDTDWIAAHWLGLIREERGLDHGWPDWLDRPALTRLTISSPDLLDPFKSMNEGKPYADQVKPFNFVLTAHVTAFGHPVGVDPTRFQLVAPYESDPTKWKRLRWINRYSCKEYGITTSVDAIGKNLVRVKTYGDVLKEFRFHPEAKSAGPDGLPCGPQTRGLLQRRRVRAVPELLTHVGKESNKLEEMDAGIEHDPDEIWTEYRDANRDPWLAFVVPVLKAMSLIELVAATGLSDRALRAIRNAHTMPRPTHKNALLRSAAAFARGHLQAAEQLITGDDLVACAAYRELARMF